MQSQQQKALCYFLFDLLCYMIIFDRVEFVDKLHEPMLLNFVMFDRTHRHDCSILLSP